MRITVSGYKALDPRDLYASAVSIGSQTDFWGLANSLTTQVGIEPASAWILLSRASMNALDVNGAHTIEFSDGSGTVFSPDWSIHRAILAGSDGDGRAPYLVELRDKRQLLKLSTINKRYNVLRSPCDSSMGGAADVYLPETLNGGNPWTWQEMLEDVWGELPAAIAGACPTLPYAPSHDPQNMQFLGVPTLTAIDQILKLCQSVLTLNSAGAFGLAQIGTAQSGMAAAVTALASYRIHDWSPKQDVNRSVAPATIRVYFHKRGPSKQAEPVHHEDNPSGINGAVPGTVLGVWSSLCAEVDSNGNVINQSEIGAAAAELAAAVADQIDGATERRRIHYRGVRTAVSLGSQIHKIVWRDYGDGHGLVTEVHACADLGIAAPWIAGPSGNAQPPDTSVGLASCCKGHRFLNGSGETIPPFAMMKIVGRTLIDGEYVYTVDKLDTTFQRQVLVNSCKEVIADEFGSGTFLEDAGYIQVDSLSASTGEGWGPKPGQWKAYRYYHGFSLTGSAIEYKYTPAATGVETTIYVAPARQYIPQHVLCKTEAGSGINKDASGTLRVFVGPAGSESDSTMTISAVRNRTANVGADKFCWAIWSSEVPYLSPIECS